MTNFERIKAMSVDEMADFINHETDGICSCCVRFGKSEEKCYNIPGECKRGIKNWLESEAE